MELIIQNQRSYVPLKKLFVNVRIDTTSFLLFAYVHILMDPAPLLMANLIIDNWKPPIYNFYPNIYYFFKVCVRNLKERYSSMVCFKISKWKSNTNLFCLECGANYPESEKLCTIKKTICERSHWHNFLPPVRIRSHFDGPRPPSNG